MPERPLEVVVVAYGHDSWLERSVMAATAIAPVTVVDNSSLPAIAELAERCGAVYDDPGDNLGFAAGVNRGLRRVSPDCDVLLVNPDAVVTSDGVTRMRGSLTDPRVAAVAPRLLGPDGKAQQVAWPLPSPARAWRQALLGGAGGAGAHFLVGAVLLLRREALNDVGAFDERFFLYAEETDWQRRALLKQWKLVVCEDATAEHLGAGTSTDQARREALFHAGSETYIRKWFGSSGWQSYRLASIVREVLRLPVARDRRSRVDRARLYVRGPRRVAGLDP